MKAGNKADAVWTLVFLLFLLPTQLLAQQRYPAQGLVLGVDRAHSKMQVSLKKIPGFMDAMVMTFAVAAAKSLDALKPGTMIEFVLVVDQEASHAEKIHIHRYDSAEREPSKASRLRTFDEALRGPVHSLAIGQPVPNFTLTDQMKRPTGLGDFAGKVIALNFVYTRCTLPEYCVRSSNDFGVIQKQFHDRLGKDLILLTITFDPVHDQPEVLREYASRWKADPDDWHFLTGTSAEVARVCDLFGVTSVPAEGLFVHSQRTAIVDRRGKLVANLEGNEFTAQQLADLIQKALESR